MFVKINVWQAFNTTYIRQTIGAIFAIFCQTIYVKCLFNYHNYICVLAVPAGCPYTISTGINCNLYWRISVELRSLEHTAVTFIKFIMHCKLLTIDKIIIPYCIVSRCAV